jgi:group I intron endonuclease
MKKYRINRIGNVGIVDRPPHTEYKCIYEIRCVLNGRRYIGSSVDLTKRWNEHIMGCLSSLVFGSLTNVRLQRDVKEFGIENFTFRILKKCFTLSYDEMLALELQMIKEQQPYYNIEGK